MRALPQTLSAAIGRSAPLVRLELMDTTPHYAAVYSGGPLGRSAACLAADGAVVQAYNDLAGGVYTRRVPDPTATAWGAWQPRASGVAAEGGVALALLGSRLGLFWVQGGGTAVLGSYSDDNAGSWSAPLTLFDAGGTVHGLAADGDPGALFVQYSAADGCRLAQWTQGAGGWVKGDWPFGASAGGSGVAALRRTDGSYLLAAALQAQVQVGGQSGGTAVQTYRVGGGWTALATAAPSDLGLGVTVADPRLALYDGRYTLACAVVDSGSVSGLPSARTAVQHSRDGVHWSDPLEDSGSYAHGATPLRPAAGYLLAGADTAALAPPYSGSATQYRDCTADLSRLDVVQKDGAPARLVVTLQNDSGVYDALPALRRNAVLLLSLGYGGGGTVPAYRCYLEGWSAVVAAGEREVVLTAVDALGALERQSRATLTWSGQTVGWLAVEVTARAGLLTVTLPTTAQFARSVARFAVPAGGTWRAALERLSRLYGFAVAARTAGDGSDALVLMEKGAGDPVAWNTGAAVESAVMACESDRANHVLVYGAPGSGLPLGEGWDWADVVDTGQERFLQVVEPLIADAAGAALRAALELAREGRRAVAGSLVLPLHPGLELWDLLAVALPGRATVTRRVAALHHLYEPHPGSYDVVATIEGV